MKKLLLFTVMSLLALFLVSCGAEPPATTTYTVTFDSDGGSTVNSVTVNSGETVAAPADPTKEYSTFDGWYQGEKKYNFTFPVTSDITLTAKWERNEYRVKFDTAGGNIIDRAKVLGGDSVQKPQDPTKENYDFDGWYMDGAEYDFSAPVSADITLTAKWKLKNFTVSFDVDGGTETASQTVEVFKTATRPADPEKIGYLFEGWYVGKTRYDF